MERNINIPEKFNEDLNRAIRILKDAGCKEIYLFGSLVTGETEEMSDIDLAVRGCPPDKYFGVLGQLILELEHSVDLINLDREDEFTRYLEKQGELVHVS
ncbi:MAG: nucleotidyltransferase domain-containing protein [Bacillota bacterium]|jgi:predicted nucleotidyltransferase